MKIRLWFDHDATQRLGPDFELPIASPPPRSLCMLVRNRTRAAFLSVECEPLPVTPPPIAHLELVAWSPGLELAHYWLRNGPPAGHRWSIIGPGRILQEPIA